MFGFKKDHGEQRAFEHSGEYTMTNTGKVYPLCPPGLEGETQMILAEAFYAMAEQLEHNADQLRRQAGKTINASAFQAMVSGS